MEENRNWESCLSAMKNILMAYNRCNFDDRVDELLGAKD